MIQAGAARVQAVGGVRSLNLDSNRQLLLATGETLSPLTIAFESYGALNSAHSNAVLVCHGLHGDQFVASPNPVTGRPPWWPRIVGPGRPIDTNRFFVVCANMLGGSMGTTSPASLAPDGLPYGLRFPMIGVGDIVRAQALLLETLGIDNLFLVIGAGMGGMQALNWASAFPKRVFACASVASAARQPAQNIAFAELGRQAIMADPEWRNGGYLAHGVRPSRGAALVRAAAKLSGQSADQVRASFKSGLAQERLSLAPDSREDRSDPNSHLYLSRAMDAFDLAADFGGALANAFQGAQTRHAVFAFSSDWRFPPEESRIIARALMAAGAEASFLEIKSEQGHDAYLGEEPAFESALTGFVDAAASARGLGLHGEAHLA